MSDEIKTTVPISDYDRKKLLITDRVTNSLGILSGIFLTVATVFMFINIMTRTLMDYNFIFIYDLCGLCAAGVASFAIPFAAFKRGFANMDTILAKLKPAVRAVSESIAGIVTIVIMLFTVYSVTIYAIMRTKVLESTTTSHMPTWIFRWLYVLGLILTTIAAAIELIDMVRMAKGEDVILTREALAAREEELLENAEGGTEA